MAVFLRLSCQNPPKLLYPVFPDVRRRIVGVENRRIFGYYIGENDKKAALLFVQ